MFLYVAPFVGIYMLSVICPSNQKERFSSVVKLFKLGATVISVFLVSFLPFRSHLGQVAGRLFPVARGLTHSYWAGNIWAVYNFVDLVLSKIFPSFGISHVTSGKVGAQELAVLPEIKPLHCVILMLISISPMLFKIWKRPRGREIEGYCICALASFIFGYHVHEKAILLAIVPFTAVGECLLSDMFINLSQKLQNHFSL